MLEFSDTDRTNLQCWFRSNVALTEDKLARDKATEMVLLRPSTTTDIPTPCALDEGVRQECEVVFLG